MPRLPPTPGWVRLTAAALCSLLGAATACALEWTNGAGFRFASVPVAPGVRTGFTLLSPDTTGVRFTNFVAAERHLQNQILLNGSGVTAGDVDGDGWCDLFFSGLGGGSVLYRNLGNWHFEDVTRRAGLNLAGFDATGAAFVDFDGDGDLDLIVNSIGGGTRLLLNDGRGHFSPAPQSGVLNPGHGGSSLALADIDGDGDLDLYIANYQTYTIRDQPGLRLSMKTVNGEPQVVAINGRALTNADLVNRFDFRYRPVPGGGGSVLHDELGEADVLCENAGGGRFAPLSFTNGAFLDEQGRPLKKPPFDWGLSVMIRDLNGDGAPDIYVCNDFTTPDRIWINDGRGHFRALPTPAVRQTSLSTMAIDVADINRDGFDDIFTADMLSRERWRRLVQKNEPNPNMSLFVEVTGRPQFPRNMLQLNRGDGTYAEIAQLAGIEASEWTWTPAFLDVDLDGFEDLLVVNGFERDYMNMDANRRMAQMRAGRPMSAADIRNLNRLYPRLVTTNLAFRNLGNLRFTEVGAAWGFNLAAISQGMCLADFDNDGDLDVTINNLNGPAAFLRNDTTGARVAFRLRGKAPNTRGIGARIRLLGGSVPTQQQEMICGGRYLSSDDAMRVFAAGSPANRMTLEVTWRNGSRSVVRNVEANRIYEVEESGAVPGATPRAEPARKAPALFRDVSALLHHAHQQGPFDDFDRQPLLPNKLSTLGPGLSWFDVDQDGREDLIIAGGKGSAMAVYRNSANGQFTRMTNGTLNGTLARSQTAVLGTRTADGRVQLLAGSSSFEDVRTNGGPVRIYRLDAGAVDDALSGWPSSAGPLALADVDGDGDLDLFAGGRVIAGRWPEAASSLLLRQENGRWAFDEPNAKVLTGIGLVSGAVFTDMDGDGDPDLVLACEWGPLRVFRNDRGAFSPWDWPVTIPAGDSPLDAQLSTLGQLTGWWTGVSAGDFDGDGRMDLVAANWGRNSKYESFRAKPLRVYYGDFVGDGGVTVWESWFDRGLGDYAPILNVWTMSRSQPWLLERFPSFEAFSRASVAQALGDRFGGARYWEAGWLDSTVFLNRGDHFEARPLPIEAQFAPAFAVCVGDFDGDGHEDFFLSQNFFGVRPETSRYDAGRGLLLRGDGRGGFTAVSGVESGLMIYGEQRGAAMCDYDVDGRLDLAVAQPGAETKLFHNDGARPGLRVRLAGPPGNPQGVGAVLRLKSGAGLGPGREIHAGTGYWSQDSVVQVMAAQQSAEALQITWPGGRVTTVAIPDGAKEVEVQAGGTVRVVR